MPEHDTQIDLDALHQAILDAIAAQFPALTTVADYPEDRAQLIAPACLVELIDLEPTGEDPGTGQLAALARFSARIVLGFRTPGGEREVRKLAAALAVFVHQQRWGLPIAPAEVTAIEPDDFEPQLDRFLVWSVQWAQVVHLGASVWTNDGAIPQALFSFTPYIGVPNEPAYQPIEDPSL
jgi:hypothetical protein